MKENYPKAYTEVLEILKYMPTDDVNKIPKELIDTFEYKRDNNYNFTIGENQDFSKLKILEETEAIMVNIFKDYWASPEQKAKIRAKQQYDMQIIEEEKKKKYNVDIFNKKEDIRKQDTHTEKNINNSNLPIDVKQERFYKKIIHFFKRIFYKNNK